MIADGIYFRLDENEYHKDLALGSTDIRRLLRSPPDWWWSSALNPLRPSTDPTAAQFFGRAVHKFVLEGKDAFERAYAAAEFPGNIKAGIEERKIIKAEGREPLRRDDYNRIVLSSQMIRANPHLAEAFSGGEPEVSMFWTRPDGTRMKCRFDYLKVRAFADLKSIRNSRGIDFVDACRRSLADYRYEVQASHYMEGRSMLGGFVADNKVFGDCDGAWLAKAAASEEFAAVFVFWQADESPITWACSLSPGNPILEAGRRDIERAVDRYKEFKERFGLDQPWVLSEPVEELDENDLPAWAAARRAA